MKTLFHCEYPLVRLADVFSVRREIATEEQLATGAVLMVDRVSFEGEIFAGDKADTKMTQYIGRQGDVIVSKIRARQGSIGYLDPKISGMKPVSVTIHYRVLTPMHDCIDGRFAWLALRSDIGKAKFLAATGGAMKGEISEQALLEMQIPLPPLPVQRAIVERWQAAQEAVAAAGERIARIERETQARFLADLGLTLPERATPPKAFALRWQDLERWGVQLAWQAHRREHNSKFPMKPLREICKTGSGGTPSRQRKEYYGGGIPWVKTTEVRNNTITTTEETLSEEGLAKSAAKLYPAGSIVIAMYGQGATRGRTAKLGIDAATNQACLILTDFTNSLLPDFVWAYLMNRYHDIRVLASGNNQPNLSAELIGSFPIPLPPPSVQRSIIERVEVGRAEIAREREAAERLRTETRTEVEEMILGLRKVDSLPK